MKFWEAMREMQENGRRVSPVFSHIFGPRPFVEMTNDKGLAVFPKTFELSLRDCCGSEWEIVWEVNKND